MFFKAKRTGNIHNFTIYVNPCYKYNDRFRGDIQWYMMDNEGFISCINFKLKNENDELVSFNGLSITFRLSLKEI